MLSFFCHNSIKLSQKISNCSDLIHDIELFFFFFTRYSCHLLNEIQKKTFVYDRPNLICTVKNNVRDVTGYAGRGISSLNIIHLLIRSVYEYGLLQNYVISKLLRKHILLFSQYSSNTQVPINIKYK